jgi:low temperature requirement protein LtrA
MTEHPSELEHRVTPVELFFDLVFVFAFTQVTTLMTDDPTWTGLGEGLMVLAALWSVWAAYAWLTNVADPDEGPARGAMLVAIGATFIAALAVPDVFGEHGVLFGVAFLIVRVMHVVLYALAGRGNRDLLAAVLRITPTTVATAGLIIAAGFTDDGLRIALWLAALAVDYVGPLLTGVSGWRVHPGHFAERHALIMIIALGEAFIAMGVSATGTEIDSGTIFTVLLGLVVATSMWLAYFDFFSIRAEGVLHEREGAERNAVARDIFTYLHLPMVAGIVLVALALKKTMANVDDALDVVPAFGLFGGSALYLLAYVGIRLRLTRSLSRGRSVAAAAFLVLWPVAVAVPALAGLALATLVWVLLHAYEFVWWRDARAETRALRLTANS